MSYDNLLNNFWMGEKSHRNAKRSGFEGYKNPSARYEAAKRSRKKAGLRAKQRALLRKMVKSS